MTSSALIEHDRISAVFRTGSSPLGHHWRLLDAAEEEIGRTRFAYEGAGKVLGRTTRAIGLGTGRREQASVEDTAGTVQFRLRSSWGGKERTIEVVDGDDQPVGHTRRDGRSLQLHGAGDGSAFATVTRDEDEQPTMPIVTAAGDRIGVITTRRFEGKLPSLLEDIVLPELSTNRAALQATIHLGMATSPEYHLIVEHAPADSSRRAMLALAPVLAAYTH